MADLQILINQALDGSIETNKRFAGKTVAYEWNQTVNEFEVSEGIHSATLPAYITEGHLNLCWVYPEKLCHIDYTDGHFSVIQEPDHKAFNSFIKSWCACWEVEFLDKYLAA